MDDKKTTSQTSATKERGRKKKQNSIVLKGEGLNGENTVQMAQRLYRSITTTSLSLNSMKLLDVYLSKINSHDPSHKTVVFEYGEIERLFGLKQIRKEALISQLRELLTISVFIAADTETNEVDETQLRSLLLFDKAKCERDKSDGLWKVTMMCSEDAEPLMFNIDSKGYLQHALQNSVRLPSSRSFLLYKFIESHRDNKRGYPQEFEITVDNLRTALNCTAKTYQQFKRFNNDYLKECRADILENTDTRFDYEPIKKGARIFKVKFTIYARAKYDVLPETVNNNEPVILETEDAADNIEIQVEPTVVDDVHHINPDNNTAAANSHFYYGNSFDETSTDNREAFTSQAGLSKEIKLLAAACDNEFSPRQMETLSGFITFFIQDEIEKYNYLRSMYEKLKLDPPSEEDDFVRIRRLIETDPELRMKS